MDSTEFLPNYSSSVVRMSSFEYTFGIEEEYFAAQADDAGLAAQIPEQIRKRAREEFGESVTSELLQSQIEVASPIFHDVGQARETMFMLRTRLNAMLEEEQLRLVAASTHPLGAWREQLVTEERRYDKVLSDFRIIGERNLVCGMHVHVAVPTGVDRVQLMNRAMAWLPLFLALSTSSPFWDGRLTGLMSYRQAIYDEWPRSGIPDFFQDQRDYDAFVELLQKADAIKDASFLWWAIRPALRYPTLELRIADVCTRLEDGIALASLFRCLVATLVEQPQLNVHHSSHTRRLIDENRWRCKRDGIDSTIVDESRQMAIPARQAIDELLTLVGEQSDRLGCSSELAHIPNILQDGTSAHAQLRIYNESRANGASSDEALREVVRWLIDATIAMPDGATSIS
ncbi:MAG: carboxylate-amine ligase [Povalibacter sp.]